MWLPACSLKDDLYARPLAVAMDNVASHPKSRPEFRLEEHGQTEDRIQIPVANLANPISRSTYESMFQEDESDHGLSPEDDDQTLLAKNMIVEALRTAEKAHLAKLRAKVQSISAATWFCSISHVP